jgi:3'(2'), 5'-bisphosphate nucleotidase
MHVDIQAVIALAEQAGKKIMAYYQRAEFSVQTKADGSPLTEADLIAHETLVAGFSQLTADIPVVSEEHDENILHASQQWQRFWLIDPLDGTREFIRRNDNFVVNIALMEKQKPIFGLIYAPVTQIAYYAMQGQGAFKQQQGKRQTISAGSERQKIIVAAGHYYKIEKFQNMLQGLGEFEIMSVGSALKFCLIAEGKADLYPRVGKSYEWDTAAGQVIVEEAGGLVIDFAGNPLTYRKESLLNPGFLAVADNPGLILKLKDSLHRRL